MFKKILVLLLIALLIFSFTSCFTNGAESKDNLSKSTSKSDDESVQTSAVHQGDPVPTFDVDWPSEMLPDDFPDLGKVTKIYDSRAFINKVTIHWNILTEDQVEEIVEKLNAYLDYDHAWQDYFYSDGLKYKPGTEDEYIRVVIRYSPTASGEIEPDFKPQFYLEISGEGIPDID